MSEAVSPNLEITEIQTRLMAEGGPAVLFENVVDNDGRPYDAPVLVNLFGTVERVALGMNRKPKELREIGETLAFLSRPEPPGGWREAFDMMPILKTVMAMRPKSVSRRPVRRSCLRATTSTFRGFRFQSCWPGEPALLITWPLVVTKGPGGDGRDGFNLGIYRMQVTGRDTTLMRWLSTGEGRGITPAGRRESASPCPPPW